MYFENIVFVAISLIDYLKNFSFSLGVLDALSAFLADLNGNFSSILLFIDALDHLSKASCTKQAHDDVAIAELLSLLDLVESLFYICAGSFILYSFVTNCVDLFEITDLCRLELSKLVFVALQGFGRCDTLIHFLYYGWSIVCGIGRCSELL